MRTIPGTNNYIGIHCLCGRYYDAPGFRLVKCPVCSHVWDLRPDQPAMDHVFAKVGTERIRSDKMTPCICQDLGDMDFYSFTMGQLAFSQFPYAKVRWKYINRAKEKTDRPGFVKELREQTEMMTEKRLTPQLRAYFEKQTTPPGSSRPYLKPTYLDWLSQFRFDPSQLDIKQDERGELSLFIEGPLYSTPYWEQPLLYTIGQLRRTLPNSGGQVFEKQPGWREKISKKGERLSAAGVNWIEFGTRRRYDVETQDAVLQDHRQYLVRSRGEAGFRGTSNPYFALKYGLPMHGTFAHWSVMAMQALYSLAECNNKIMEHWIKEYEGNLGVALTDTITTEKFLESFGSLFANTFQGVRHDSGDPFAFGERIIKHYEGLGIDPITKIIVFSDSLDVDKAINLHNHFKDRIRTTMGIGTHLTNDVGYPPANHVIKAVQADFGHGWVDLVKLSDDLGKVTGETQAVADACRLLRIKH